MWTDSSSIYFLDFFQVDNNWFVIFTKTKPIRNDRKTLKLTRIRLIHW